jgi:UTP--glucose-1-phosphate uridylyltransferase
MSAVTKAVIPAAGLGTRFLPATKAQPKEMLPVVDRPAIQYVVEEAVKAGIDDILIITGRGKRSLEDHFDRNFELEHQLHEKGKSEDLIEVRELADLADIHYVRQGEALGLGHAVAPARKHVGDHPFVVMLGDDIMVDGAELLTSMIDAYEEQQASIIALLEVPHEDIGAYGCVRPQAVSDRLVKVLDIVEKPDPSVAPSDLAVVGRYVLTPEIFEVLETVQPGYGGEIQLTDALATLVKTQGVFGYTFDQGRYDIGMKIDYLRATVEIALQREDLGPAFRDFLKDLSRREGW